MPANALTHIGPLRVDEFMRRYWQKRPIVIRAALGATARPLVAGFTPQRLFALAARDEVESRLVTSFDGWRLRHGPFARLPSRQRPGWTLLVQGVDAHDDDAARLLRQFRFIPDARLDDLMISYATDCGGVGPHVDSYDVFLLQARGRRRWRISRQRDVALVDGLPLKILARFEPTAEWVLEPGDVLYLPPGVAHEGVAVGDDCMTCSIGFRTPTWQELAEPLLDVITQRVRVKGRYRDPEQPATQKPARLPAALVAAAARELQRLRPRPADVQDALLLALSEPKPNVVFAPPRARSFGAFAKAVSQRGVALDRRTRLLYSGRRAAINGELIDAQLQHPAGAALRALADQRRLPATVIAALPEAFVSLLHAWHAAGWLHFEETSP